MYTILPHHFLVNKSLAFLKLYQYQVANESQISNTKRIHVNNVDVHVHE